MKDEELKEGEKKDDKKKKMKIKTTDLPVKKEVPQLTKEQINIYMENEVLCIILVSVS